MAGCKYLLWGLGAVALAGLAYVYWSYDPSIKTYAFPSCPLKWATGYDCAGCGSQRAIHHLLHLDIGKAFSYNPLFVSSIPYLLGGFALDRTKNRGPKLRWVRDNIYGGKAIWVAFAIIMLFWIGRNIW